MTAHVAKVVALTAEVRALMVGSRQVTLSVYRQLDTVDALEVEPFGRVRDGKDREAFTDYQSRVDGSHVPEAFRPAGYYDYSCHEKTEVLYVVGRRHGTGVLVRASTAACTHRTRGGQPWIEFEHGEALWERWKALDLIVLAGLR